MLFPPLFDPQTHVPYYQGTEHYITVSVTIPWALCCDMMIYKIYTNRLNVVKPLTVVFAEVLKARKENILCLNDSPFQNGMNSVQSIFH